MVILKNYLRKLMIFVSIFFFLFSFKVKSKCQTPDFYFDSLSRKTVNLNNNFELFFTLQNYHVNNFFFLKKAILLWDSNNSKFILIDYNSRSILDEYTLDRKKGFKTNKFNENNEFFYNSLMEPLITSDSSVSFGIVKTGKNSFNEVKGYQLLNINIIDSKIQPELVEYKPEQIFQSIISENKKDFAFQKGLAVLQYRNMIGLEDNKVLFQFFGKPFVLKKKKKADNYQIINPVILLHENKNSKFLLNDFYLKKSNLNLYQIKSIKNNLFVFRSYDNLMYCLQDSSIYQFDKQFVSDSQNIMIKSEIFNDYKTNFIYIVKSFKLDTLQKVMYKIYKISSIDTMKKVIYTSNILNLYSDDKLNIEAIYNNYLYIVDENNPVFGNEAGIYKMKNDIQGQLKNIFIDINNPNILQGDSLKITSVQINNGNDNSEYRKLSVEESIIFPEDSFRNIDIEECQTTIKCLLETVNLLIEKGLIRYIFLNYILYDEEDIYFLKTNSTLLKQRKNLETFLDVFSYANKNYDSAIWRTKRNGIIEGFYKDKFTIFVIKKDSKYFLSVNILK